MCVFCDIINHKIPSKTVYENDDVLAILDIAQVTRGHTIVMPKKHVKNIVEADADTVSACMETVRTLAAVIQEKTGCSGINILNNCGESAGQSVDHLHFHIIPRYGSKDAVTIAFGSSEPQDLDEVLQTIRG